MNLWGVLAIIFVILFVGVILWIALPPLISFANDSKQRELVESLDESHRLMCGIPDELDVIFDTIDIISSDKFDNRAKGIYQQMQWGKDIESCDIIYLYNQLELEQKKKLNWLELSCNVRHCLES
jgi:hypothetical protein